MQIHRVMHVIGDESMFWLPHGNIATLCSAIASLASYVTESSIFRNITGDGMEGRLQIFHSTSEDGVGCSCLS